MTEPTTASKYEYAPWMVSIRNIVDESCKEQAVDFQKLWDAEFLTLVSDYGGDHQESDYQTYSYLITDPKSIETFRVSIADLRSLHKIENPKRAISYKSMKGPQLRAIKGGWITLVDQMQGVLLVICVRKNIKSLGGESGQSLLVRALQAAGAGNWKKRPAERFFRIVNFAGLLSGIVARPEQTMCWISDNDEIVNREERTLVAVQEWMARRSMYGGVIGNDSLFHVAEKNNDLLSVVDLACGAAAELFTKAKTEKFSTKQGNAELIGWLIGHEGNLKKIFVCLSSAGSEQINVFKPVFNVGSK